MNRAGLIVVVAALLLAVVTSWTSVEGPVQGQLDDTQGMTSVVTSSF
jgi:hypothetical protein